MFACVYIYHLKTGLLSRVYTASWPMWAGMIDPFPCLGFFVCFFAMFNDKSGLFSSSSFLHSGGHDNPFLMLRSNNLAQSLLDTYCLYTCSDWNRVHKLCDCSEAPNGGWLMPIAESNMRRISSVAEHSVNIGHLFFFLPNLFSGLSSTHMTKCLLCADQ